MSDDGIWYEGPPYLECRQCCYGTTSERLADKHCDENPGHDVQEAVSLMPPY